MDDISKLKLSFPCCYEMTRYEETMLINKQILNIISQNHKQFNLLSTKALPSLFLNVFEPDFFSKQ